MNLASAYDEACSDVPLPEALQVIETWAGVRAPVSSHHGCSLLHRAFQASVYTPAWGAAFTPRFTAGLLLSFQLGTVLLLCPKMQSRALYQLYLGW